jgi:hypothetical protein
MILCSDVIKKDAIGAPLEIFKIQGNRKYETTQGIYLHHVIYIYIPAALALGSTQPLTEMSTRNL